jgi:hypothetical protein
MNRWIMLIIGFIGGVCITFAALVVFFGTKADLPSREKYETALSETADERTELVESGSETETRALQSFKDAFEEYTRENLEGRLKALYADDAYFNDNLVELRGGKVIEDYFLASVDLVESCSFDIEDVASSQGNYYVRWTMTIRMKNAGNRPDNVSSGVTLLRFNPEGQIILHQDFWDSASLMRELPVVGGMINYVKKRIASNH